MERTLQQMRDYVRLSLDVDEEELGDDLLNQYASDAWERAIGVSRVWKFYGVEYVLSTVAGTQSYNVMSNVTADRPASIVDPLASITDVRSDVWPLANRGHARQHALYTQTSPASSRPYEWSEFGQSLYLWPTPDTTYSIRITGYRQPRDWLGTAPAASATPDAPPEFHNMIQNAMLAASWAQQSDPEMAEFYSRSFAQDLSRVKARYATPMHPGIYVLGGGQAGSRQVGDRLRYDWEF